MRRRFVSHTVGDQLEQVETHFDGQPDCSGDREALNDLFRTDQAPDAVAPWRRCRIKARVSRDGEGSRYHRPLLIGRETNIRTSPLTRVGLVADQGKGSPQARSLDLIAEQNAHVARQTVAIQDIASALAAKKDRPETAPGD